MMDAPLLFSAPPAPAARKAALPIPKVKRWQPLRLGLVELYHYGRNRRSSTARR
jgi:hypothetical protein